MKLRNLLLTLGAVLALVGGAIAADPNARFQSLVLTGTPLAVTSGGTGVTTSTGTGSNVLSASPALTGTPTAPTAGVGTSSTQLATTAFVQAAQGTYQTIAVTSGTTSLAWDGVSRLIRLTGASIGTVTVNTITPAVTPTAAVQLSLLVVQTGTTLSLTSGGNFSLPYTVSAGQNLLLNLVWNPNSATFQLGSGNGLSAVVGALGYTPGHAGANSDITSLTGLTTPLSVGQGGTGASTAAAGLSALGGVPAGLRSTFTSSGTYTRASTSTFVAAMVQGAGGGGGHGGTYNASRATTGASGTGTTATISYSGQDVMPVGSTVIVSGVTPAGYNGTFTVTASSAGSVSFANATTGSQTVAGVLTNGGSCGASGGSGGWRYQIWRAADLPASINITVGAAGPGGVLLTSPTVTATGTTVTVTATNTLVVGQAIALSGWAGGTGTVNGVWPVATATSSSATFTAGSVSGTWTGGLVWTGGGPGGVTSFGSLISGGAAGGGGPGFLGLTSGGGAGGGLHNGVAGSGSATGGTAVTFGLAGQTTTSGSNPTTQGTGASGTGCSNVGAGQAGGSNAWGPSAGGAGAGFTAAGLGGAGKSPGAAIIDGAIVFPGNTNSGNGPNGTVSATRPVGPWIDATGGSGGASSAAANGGTGGTGGGFGSGGGGGAAGRLDLGFAGGIGGAGAAGIAQVVEW